MSINSILHINRRSGGKQVDKTQQLTHFNDLENNMFSLH